MNCPECEGKLVLRNSKHGLFYGCNQYPACKATHGAHPDGVPLGIPGNKKTKEARMRAHDVFDKYWKQRKMTRKAAYRWLQYQMSMTKEECHIAKFNIEQCEAVLWVCKHGGNFPLRRE